MNARNLDQRIADLHADVDPELRSGLVRQLRTLRETGNVVGVLIAMSPLCLQLVRLVFSRANERTPSDNLYDCIVRGAGGDPSRKVEGLRLIPDEIATGLHTIRILANKPDHAAEGVVLGVADAENALNLFLRAFQWYSVEYPKGPGLPAFYRPQRAPLSMRIAWGGGIAVAAVAVAIIGYGAIERSKDVPEPVASGRASTSKSRELPAGLDNGVPDPSPRVESAARPRLLLQILVDRGRQNHYVDLPDGAPVASEVDDYLVVVQPQTAGYLYVFQVDARGEATWLFPRNATSDLSSGTNPVIAGTTLQVPPPELKSALYLDQNRGDEHLYAVFSTGRWDAFEARERQTPATGLASFVKDERRTRGPKGIRPKPQTFVVERNGLALRIDGVEYEASGDIMIVERWFRHE